MRRYSRQAHLSERIDQIAEAMPQAQRTRPQLRRLADRVGDNERVRIATDRREGATLPSLEQKYSLSSYSLRLILAEAGIPPAKLAIHPERLDQIRAMVHADCTTMEIARATDAPQSSVRLIVAYLRAVGPLNPDRGR